METEMKTWMKPAMVLGIAGALAIGTATASQARVKPWVAGAAGFAAGAAIGAAAANANAYYGRGYYDAAYDPTYAYTGDPAYAAGYAAYGYAPGYEAYAYAPRYHRGYWYGDARTRSVPHHYDPGAGYNSNTVAPWQDWKLQGHDY
jgi:hypothetical protein